MTMIQMLQEKFAWIWQQLTCSHSNAKTVHQENACSMEHCPDCDRYITYGKT